MTRIMNKWEQEAERKACEREHRMDARREQAIIATLYEPKPIRRHRYNPEPMPPGDHIEEAKLEKLDSGFPCPFSPVARCCKPNTKTCAELDCPVWADTIGGEK